MTCGLLVFGLVIADLLKHRSAEALLLGLWVVGTFDFAGFVNWTCNGRSVLPLVPAVALLLVRRAENEATRDCGPAERLALGSCYRRPSSP